LKKDFKTADDRFKSATKRTRGSAKASAFPLLLTLFYGLRTLGYRAQRFAAFLLILAEHGRPLLQMLGSRSRPGTCCFCRRTLPTWTSRTTLEVHEASRPIRLLPPDFPGLSSRHPRVSRRFVNQVLPATGLVDDAEFAAIRWRLTHGRVRN